MISHQYKQIFSYFYFISQYCVNCFENNLWQFTHTHTLTNETNILSNTFSDYYDTFVTSSVLFYIIKTNAVLTH